MKDDTTKLMIAYAIKTEVDQMLELTDDPEMIRAIQRLDAYIDMLLK